MEKRKVNNEELCKIAKELKREAFENPCDALKLLSSGHGPPERFQRRVIFRDVPIHFTFTLTRMGSRHFYQLSCENENGGVVPEAIVDALTKAFFIGQYCEVPSIMHRNRVRQFIQDRD